MEEYENSQKIVKLFATLGATAKNKVLLELLDAGTIDLAAALAVYARHLTVYKQNAQQDMQVLARAGIDLADKEIRAIPSLKTLSTKQLKTAQAHTLLSVGSYEGTKHGDELKQKVDISIVDKDWYEQYWSLKTVSNDKPTTGKGQPE
jgi:hypothetical protein